MRRASLWLPAPLLAVALILASCGGGGEAGGGAQGAPENSGGMAGMDHDNMDHGGDAAETTAAADGMAGMDHGSMDHGSMNAEEMARQMLTENGEYSDEAFIDSMVPHHQGAIDMAEVALQNAEHEEVRQLSEEILSTQEAEIEELKAIKEREFGSSEVPMEMSEEDMQMMGMTDPEQLAQAKPFDRVFIEAMTAHHESAVAMANVALEESEDPQVRRIARSIADAQRREISRMAQWREEWYPQG
jgi:uncharacterized protein (DUF305 family)